MKILFVAILLMLSGCTTYDVKRDSEGIVSVKVKSTRSFEAPDLHYKRDDNGVEFDFSAANADNNTDAILGAFGGMMQLMQLLILNMTVPTE
ncbi:MAG: hypothetical protein KJO91_08960 [Gammaproteobacteria bacterium]|nr:hypothetical protein [Gammaproteobacteria bacterium]